MIVRFPNLPANRSVYERANHRSEEHLVFALDLEVKHLTQVSHQPPPDHDRGHAFGGFVLANGSQLEQGRKRF